MSFKQKRNTAIKGSLCVFMKKLPCCYSVGYKIEYPCFPLPNLVKEALRAHSLTPSEHWGLYIFFKVL